MEKNVTAQSFIVRLYRTDMGCDLKSILNGKRMK